MDLVGFLSMIIYVLYTRCLRYNICSTWFLDIRISTCLLTSSTIINIIPRQNVSCLSSAKSHLEDNTLLLQLSCYAKRFKSISWKLPITLCIVAEADGLFTGSWLCIVHWDGSQINPCYSHDIVFATLSLSSALASSNKDDIILAPGFNYNIAHLDIRKINYLY